MKSYLNSTPARDQRRERLEELRNGLKAFGISKTEALQIINLMPSTSVELYLVIPNIEERYNEKQISELLAIINRS